MAAPDHHHDLFRAYIGDIGGQRHLDAIRALVRARNGSGRRDPRLPHLGLAAIAGNKRLHGQRVTEFSPVKNQYSNHAVGTGSCRCYHWPGGTIDPCDFARS